MAFKAFSPLTVRQSYTGSRTLTHLSSLSPTLSSLPVLLIQSPARPLHSTTTTTSTVSSFHKYGYTSNNIVLGRGVVANQPVYNQLVRHASSIPSNIGRSVNANQAAEQAKNLIDRIASASEAEMYHWSSIAVAASVPPALLLSPWFLAVPFDLALGIAIPLHSHIGVTQIIEDYVPREHQGLAKTALVVVTFITTIGLLKINLCGKGIAESFKSLWRRPQNNIQKQIADELVDVTKKSKKMK